MEGSDQPVTGSSSRHMTRFEARGPLSLFAAQGSYIYHKKYKFLSFVHTMRKKQKRPQRKTYDTYGNWKYERHVRMPYRPYSRANTHRDWSNYIPYKKYDDIVKAAQFTGNRRLLHLLRAQKVGELTTPDHFAARNPFSKTVKNLFYFPPYSYHLTG